MSYWQFKLEVIYLGASIFFISHNFLHKRGTQWALVEWSKKKNNETLFLFDTWAYLYLMQDFSLQVLATCNVEQSFFNDWFTGHLNFQIEHQWVIETVHDRGVGSDV